MNGRLAVTLCVSIVLHGALFFAWRSDRGSVASNASTSAIVLTLVPPAPPEDVAFVAPEISPVEEVIQVPDPVAETQPSTSRLQVIDPAPRSDVEMTQDRAAPLNLALPKVFLEAEEPVADLMFSHGRNAAAVLVLRDAKARQEFQRRQVQTHGLQMDAYNDIDASSVHVKNGEQCYDRRVTMGVQGPETTWWRRACKDLKQSAFALAPIEQAPNGQLATDAWSKGGQYGLKD